MEGRWGGMQTVVEPSGIWRVAPCLPANWVLMNHWFGVLHAPCDGWCHWCIEDARFAGSEAIGDGGEGQWLTRTRTGRTPPASRRTLRSLSRCYTPPHRAHCAVEAIVQWAGNSLPHLTPITQRMVSGSRSVHWLDRVTEIINAEVQKQSSSPSLLHTLKIFLCWPDYIQLKCDKREKKTLIISNYW